MTFGINCFIKSYIFIETKQIAKNDSKIKLVCENKVVCTMPHIFILLNKKSQKLQKIQTETITSKLAKQFQ